MNKQTLITLVLTAGLLPLAAEGKEATCLIKLDGAVAYSGQCRFSAEPDGSFSISRTAQATILPEITDLSVSIVARGVAEVRGLTINGINSRWGEARQSTNDPACWTGSDFELCAY